MRRNRVTTISDIGLEVAPPDPDLASFAFGSEAVFSNELINILKSVSKVLRGLLRRNHSIVSLGVPVFCFVHDARGEKRLNRRYL